MRVLITSDIFPPDVGGPATYVPSMAQALARRGHAVVVLCYSTVRTHPADDAYPFQLIRIPHAVPMWRRLPTTLLQVLSQGRGVDVIYANGLVTETVLANSVLRKPLLAKVVGDLAWERSRDKGWITDDFETFQTTRYAAKVELMRWRRSFSYRRMQGIVVPSEYLKRVLVRDWSLPRDFVKVVYNSFEPAATPSPPALIDLPVKYRVITVCRLTGWKGVEGLIRAVSCLPETGLVVVGDGPLREQLMQLAAALEVADRVRFCGTLPRAQVLAHLRACDVFALNSDYEGMPHVLLEAMAAGLPVVATEAGGNGEVVEHERNGILVEPHNLPALESALQRILHNPEERSALVRAGHDTVARFSHETMVDETEKLLRALVSSPTR